MSDENWEIDPQLVFSAPQTSAEIIGALADALKPFAEKPTSAMDDYPCHVGITTKEKCGRCGRAIAAYRALEKLRNEL